MTRMNRIFTNFLSLAISFTFAAASVAQPNEVNGVLISYSELWAELANPDPTPLVRVFVDGRVLIHHPHYSPMAGEYQVYLTKSEQSDLIDKLTHQEIPELNVQNLQRQIAEEEKSRANLARSVDRSPDFYMVSDDSTSIFEINTSEEGALRGSNAPPKTIVWRGLATDAARYPSIEALSALRDAELAIKSLLTHENLQMVVK